MLRCSPLFLHPLSAQPMEELQGMRKGGEMGWKILLVLL
jgi:hypothetical protein